MADYSPHSYASNSPASQALFSDLLAKVALLSTRVDQLQEEVQRLREERWRDEGEAERIREQLIREMGGSES